ncbi:glycosyl transferase [candidate division BRC1 bacterium SM23_51]|nr:MAG: glycosyl transferase [candidate division BRC1 bacterium SM23_51]
MADQAASEETRPEISVVVPLYNEEASVIELVAQLRKTLRLIGRDYEIVLVDDGSTDRTLERARQTQAGESDLRIVELQGNFGQTAALVAGFDHARGEIVISMDGDLQHNPAEIPRFLEKIDEGYDVVSGWRKQRVDSLLLRRVPSRAANWLMAKLSGIDLHDFGTTFKAYRANVLRSLVIYGQLHRFLPVLAGRAGARICEIPISNAVRPNDRSKYGLGRTFTVFFDLIRLKFLTSFFAHPLQVFGTLGLLIMLAGGAIFTWLVCMRLFYGLGLMTYRAPMFIVSVFAIVAGLQIFTLGLLGEMLVRLYYSNRRNLLYTVRRVWKAPPPPRSHHGL